MTRRTKIEEMNKHTCSASHIFGSVASDVEMSTERLNREPTDTLVAAELIREYVSTEGNAHQNLATFV
ncbi:MAG: hypothetical protein LUF25_03145 [Phascolarctobacterium sp.]|nr:hypothetical protein [Phascolarctobacterium sp.]